MSDIEFDEVVLDFLSEMFGDRIVVSDLQHLVCQKHFRNGVTSSLTLRDMGVMLSGANITIEREDAEEAGLDLDEIYDFVIEEGGEPFRKAKPIRRF